jgi:hypothetical protein
MMLIRLRQNFDELAQGRRDPARTFAAMAVTAFSGFAWRRMRVGGRCADVPQWDAGILVRN